MNSSYFKLLFVCLLVLVLTACNEKTETETEKEYMDAVTAAKLLSEYNKSNRNELKMEGIIITMLGPDEINNVLEVDLLKVNKKIEKKFKKILFEDVLHQEVRLRLEQGGYGIPQ
ncbi:hypothetical protein DV702_12995 [Sporosarcina sp. PTS2304]|uniref:hypothetical protein n=1 Tax=Sporosarcina sp. PTS2304 TaxID=2283194 RepID=UPI000E0CDDC3|nr:hypothetical protein [Sporosarcina sp. PTS2304]AXI00557.1 hypothetical protein DV702_12995 [Sporosarcina sp. PTS2304]